MLNIEVIREVASLALRLSIIFASRAEDSRGGDTGKSNYRLHYIVMRGLCHSCSCAFRS